MPCRLILGPSYPLLLHRLLDEIASTCESDPLGPKWVVVPTATTANFVRLELGRRTRTHTLAGVRVVPLTQLIRRFLHTRGDREAPRWSPALDLLLFDLVEESPGDARFEHLRRMRGGHRLLRTTFLDLADGGFGSDDADVLEELAAAPDMGGLERATLHAYRRWLDLLNARALDWEPLVSQRLAERLLTAEASLWAESLACEQDQTVRMFLHGFYDFTDTTLKLVTGLSKRVDVTILLPFARMRDQTHPAFIFVEPVLHELRLRLGSHLTLEETVPIDESHRALGFFSSTFPEGTLTERPEFISFQGASGLRAEVLSAAVQIRGWLDDADHPLQPEDILMVAPKVEPYLASVRELFAAFAIPLRLVDAPAGLTPDDRALRMLARIWEDNAPAEWVLAYLREYPRLPCRQGVDIDAFENRLRELALDGGERWLALDRLIETRTLEFSPEERALVREITELWVDRSGEPNVRRTPAQALRRLETIQRRWMVETHRLDPVIEAVRRCREDLCIPDSHLIDLLIQETGSRTRSDSVDHRGVVFVPLMRWRGLSARAVVILGLTSGQLPFRVEEDPLLPDESRRRLRRGTQAVGHRLSLKSSVPEEMSLLFFLLNTCAERIHWVIPETDETGRSAAPTPWVQRYLQRWESAAESPTESRCAYIPRSPAHQTRVLDRLDPGTGRFLPPRLAMLVDPELTTEGLGLESHRYLTEQIQHRHRDPAWNGHIPAAAWGSSGTGPETRIRVTELERLARCPFLFYSQVVAGWVPLPALEFTTGLNKLCFGYLLHALLARILCERSGPSRSLAALAEDLLSSHQRGFVAAFEAFFAVTQPALALLPPLFGEAARTRLRETLVRYLSAALAGECSDGVPLAFEEKRQRPFPDLPGVLISGQLDRVDDRDGQYHVLDYKSGKASRTKKDLQQQVRLGYLLQPVLYPWLYAHGREAEAAVSFSYVFLGDDPVKECPVSDAPSAAASLQPLKEALAGGAYFCSPDESLKLLGLEKARPCLYCDYASLCRRFDRGAPERATHFLQEYLPARVRALQGALAADDGPGEESEG